MIRPTRPRDVAGLKTIVDAIGLFPSALLEPMLAEALAGRGEDVWLTDVEDEPVAIAYLAPERMTAGTWTLLLIAVTPGEQGRGRGSALVAHVERLLVERGARLLLVETSGAPAFERARSFYVRCGFEREGRVRDFYQAGEDKIIFRKALA